jgi:hypothetical protein
MTRLAQKLLNGTFESSRIIDEPHQLHPATPTAWRAAAISAAGADLTSSWWRRLTAA